MAQVIWRLSRKTNAEFERLVSALFELADPESDEAHAFRDDIRNLPGFPNHYDIDRDVIVREFIDKTFSDIKPIIH